MQPGSDPLGVASSFTARRSAASNLPTFELPPPPLQSLHNKYNSYASQQQQQQQHQQAGSIASVGNLLTPPNTVPGESLSPITPGSLSATNSQGIPSFTSPGYWNQSSQQSSNASYGYHTGTTPNWIPPKGLYSPSSLNSLVQGNGSMVSSSQQAYEATNQLPPFTSSMSMSAVSLPAMSPSQQQQQQAMSMMSNQSPVNSQGPSSSPQHAQEAFGGRPPPTSSYYSQNQTLHAQSPYSYTNGPSPTHHTGLNGDSQQSRSDLASMQQQSSQSQNPYSRHFGQYQLPAMGDSMLSNQVGLVGGLSNGILGGMGGSHVGGMHQMYGSQHAQPQSPPNDRPFKCDQCNQSFNRNHDLKRHKRIHLAVKPYPCSHCDKSFSRKDALKRHILVKNCGKTQAAASADDQQQKEESLSPLARASSNGHSEGSPLS